MLLIKTSAYSWNNNCVIINMHGKTTIKTASLFQSKQPVNNFYRNKYKYAVFAIAFEWRNTWCL
jgi:hypothetical protein